MDKKIYEKLNDINDLNDRILLKNIMNSVFSSLENYTNERLNNLEQRIFDEIPFVEEKYNIYSTIINRNKMDSTDDFMYPILKEDIEKKEYETSEILESLSSNISKNLFKIFVQCDYLMFKKFINDSVNINGTIETNKKIYEAYFKVIENKEYVSKINKLYKSFINNNIPWTTINNPYIHKIADVVLTGCKEKISEEEEILKINVDFGEYNNYVEYNMVPVWNIKELKIKSNGFINPCIDKVNYEHTVSIAKEGINHGYLVNTENINVNCIILKKENIVILSKTENLVEWNILKFINYDEDKIPKYKYELMTNKINVNYSNKISLEKRYTIKTKSELARVINSFKASKYLRFKDVLLKKHNLDRFKETYDVNYFIIDEIRDDKIKKNLILEFEPINKDNYLNIDILSFLVSEIQFLYPEYECEGRLL